MILKTPMMFLLDKMNSDEAVYNLDLQCLLYSLLISRLFLAKISRGQLFKASLA